MAQQDLLQKFDSYAMNSEAGDASSAAKSNRSYMYMQIEEGLHKVKSTWRTAY